MGLVQSWLDKSRDEKILDATGLIMQSFFVPAAATFIGMQVLPYFLTVDKEAWSLPLWIQFLLPFTLVDYLYYWNHRLMHRAEFWWLHRVHHSSRQMDIFVTSRNSLWTVFFFVYLWTHSFLIFSQKDPSGFVYGMYLLGALDLWRHSGFKTPSGLRGLGAVLILPEDHSWHHSSAKEGINYGANLNIWDRLHGTFYRKAEFPDQIGDNNPQSLSTNLLFPWRQRK